MSATWLDSFAHRIAPPLVARPVRGESTPHKNEGDGMSISATPPAGAQAARPMTREERRVILASSLGTVFEW